MAFYNQVQLPMKCFLFLLLLPSLGLALPSKFQRLAKVTFGSETSEVQCDLVASASAIGSGASGSKARYIATEGSVTFTLAVSPTKPTFLTLKMWGGDVAGTSIVTGNTTIKLGAPRVDLWVNGRPVDADDYELLKDKPILPGCFFYRTIRLPEENTQGQSKLQLTLKPAQEIGGTYGKVGGAAPQVTPKGVYSRGYYEAISHTGNFVPDDAPPSDPYPIPGTQQNHIDYPLVHKRLVEEIDNAAAILMSRQLYGPEFDEAAAKYHIPSAVHGLFCKSGLTSYIALGTTPSPDWMTPVTGSGSGRLHSASGYIFMHVYGQEGSRYYKNPEMIQRTIALLDGYRRYQGANGAWEIGGGSDGWIGGPQRKDEAGGLQGFFIEGLARSFLAVWPYVKSSSDLLDCKIDSDGDGQPDVTRRQAWTAIFHEYLKDQINQPGGVANQARANALGAIMATRALHGLSPGDIIGQKEVSDLVDQATGLAPHPKGVWMLTQAGVSLEALGFCPSYGQTINTQFPDLIEASGDPRLRQQYEKALDLFSYMVFPLDGSAGGPLLVSGPEGSRHHEFPGKELDWLALVWAANRLHSPFAQWAVAYMLRFSHDLEIPQLTQKLGVHLLDSAVLASQCLDALPELQKTLEGSKAQDYVLPSTAPSWQNKNDPQVGLIMAHSPGHTLYAQATHGGRYQFLGSNTEAFGSLDFEEKGGVRIILYGRWLIAQNITSTAQVGEEAGKGAMLDSLPALHEARDLVSGRMLQLDEPLRIPPLATVIFDLSALGNPEVHNLAYP